MKKRGQINLSFGMIFSIILIIAFVAFAFYAIVKLLDFQKSAKVGAFLNDFKTDVDRIWRGGGGSQRVNYSLPSNIERVCFIDYVLPADGNAEERGIYGELRNLYYEEENMFFYPKNSAGELSSQIIPHIDIGKTTEDKNPLCIKTTNGKISLLIKMSTGESLVTVAE